MGKVKDSPSLVQADTQQSSTPLAYVTLSIRHGIVKRIAPLLYYQAFYDPETAVPRPAILKVKAIMRDQLLIGVEIGVAHGINAESILKTLRIKKLFLIDPYEPFFSDGALRSEVFDMNVTRLKELAIERLSRFKDKIEFINLTSDEAVSQLPEGLDFVYIDGNHDYEYVKRDITSYYPKVKEGGIIGGHDFGSKYLGVVRAVVEFSSDRSLELMSDRYDWWIVKSSNS
jgi:hypothetical protein